MLTSAFWRSTLERALKTFVQALIAVYGTGQVGVLELDWPAMLGLAGTAAVLSVLTSIASSPFGLPGSPSITDRP